MCICFVLALVFFPSFLFLVFVYFMFCVFPLSFSSLLLLLSFYWLSAALLPLFNL